MFWELFFMLVVLKIPVVYLCAVVWWAIRAEPLPLEGAASAAALRPMDPSCDWRRRRALRRGPSPRRTGPRGGLPARVVYARARASA